MKLFHKGSLDKLHEFIVGLKVLRDFEIEMWNFVNSEKYVNYKNFIDKYNYFANNKLKKINSILEIEDLNLSLELLESNSDFSILVVDLKELKHLLTSQVKMFVELKEAANAPSRELFDDILNHNKDKSLNISKLSELVRNLILNLEKEYVMIANSSKNTDFIFLKDLFVKFNFKSSDMDNVYSVLNYLYDGGSADGVYSSLENIVKKIDCDFKVIGIFIDKLLLISENSRKLIDPLFQNSVLSYFMMDGSNTLLNTLKVIISKFPSIVKDNLNMRGGTPLYWYLYNGPSIGSNSYSLKEYEEVAILLFMADIRQAVYTKIDFDYVLIKAIRYELLKLSEAILEIYPEQILYGPRFLSDNSYKNVYLMVSNLNGDFAKKLRKFVEIKLLNVAKKIRSCKGYDDFTTSFYKNLFKIKCDNIDRVNNGEVNFIVIPEMNLTNSDLNDFLYPELSLELSDDEKKKIYPFPSLRKEINVFENSKI